MARMYDPGKFKHYIEILEYTNSEPDEFGFSKEEWVVTRKVRSIVKNPSASKIELYKADGYAIQNLLEFVFRYKNDLFSTKTRVKYKDKVYEIIKAENVEELSRYTLLLGKLVE